MYKYVYWCLFFLSLTILLFVCLVSLAFAYPVAKNSEDKRKKQASYFPYSSGSYNYPTGSFFPYSSGSYNYPTGSYFPYSSGSYNYPTGSYFPYSSGSYNFPSGAASGRPIPGGK